MSIKTYTVEQSISKLQETKVALSRTQTVQDACQALGIHDTTMRWGFKRPRSRPPSREHVRAGHSEWDEKKSVPRELNLRFKLQLNQKNFSLH